MTDKAPNKNSISESEEYQAAIRKVLVDLPLYTKVEMSVPVYPTGIFPGSLLKVCRSCGMERPFRDLRSRGGGAGMGARPKTKEGEILMFSYSCTGCGENFQGWVKFSVEQGHATKVGQHPPWDIAIERELSEALGEDTEFYSKASICISQSYGLGACAYLRRVLENNINFLLSLLADVGAQEGMSGEELDELRAIMDGRPLDEKLRLAYQFVPSTLVVDGTNPLKLLYDLLSIEVHRGSDGEATRTAVEISNAFEYVVLELKRHLASRKRFAETVRRLRAR